MEKSRTFTKRHLLLVEGRDEFGLFSKLIEHLGVTTVDVHWIEGVPDLRTKLRVISKIEGFADVTHLAILLDSDGDPVARQQSIRDALQAAKLPVPPAPGAYEGNSPAVMYTTVPGPQSHGCLEDLLIGTFAGNPKAVCVDAFLQCAELLPNPWTARRSKAWVHSMLSLQEKPGLKVGEAAKAGYFDFGHAALQDVRQVVQDLAAH